MTYETTETGAVFHITNNPSAAPALQRSAANEEAQWPGTAAGIQGCAGSKGCAHRSQRARRASILPQNRWL